MSLSDSLGTRKSLHLPQGEIVYRERGEGPPIVFAHEFPANGDTWRKVVPLLADDYRCIVADWPYGPHEVPLERSADLSLRGLTRLMAGFMRALDLEDVTLVGSGGGGTLCQIITGSNPDLVTRLVINTGDALWEFPAWRLRGYQALGFIPPAGWLFVQLCRWQQFNRWLYRQAARHPIEQRVLASYSALLRASRSVRRDMAKSVRGLRTSQSVKAISELVSYDGRVLITWTRETNIFPFEIGESLANLVRNARLVELSDCGIFVGEDQPEHFAELIGELIGEQLSGCESVEAGANGAREPVN
jgi:pimeloyl-ACP methyl ester carboxylesterase